jgi:hypothetical protein
MISAWVSLSLLLLFAALMARWPRRAPSLGRAKVREDLTEISTAVDRAAKLTRRVGTSLQSPIAPWIAGLICALAVGYVWGSLDPVPIYHDEAAYLLQARLFAQGAAAGPPAPLPKFFEQFHVLVGSVLAPKYPPGFALALVPGIWIGSPALMPLLLTGITGGLLFLLSRKAAGGPVALLATAIWTIAPANLLLHASYFSQTLSAALWLAGWWALLTWREDRRKVHLVLVGVIVGWLAITRPFTALLYALPLSLVVLRDVVVQRRWRALGLAMGAGSLILLLLPIHNRLVTGLWLEMPYSRYTTTHLPFDRMGFGLAASGPTVPLPPDMVALTQYFESIHVSHTLAKLPVTLVGRTLSVLSGLSNGTPLLFGILVILGLFRSTASVLFATVSAIALLIGHLVYAHPPEWILYYEEGFPVIALLAALGISRLIEWVLRFAAVTELAGGPEARRPLVLVVASLGLALLLPGRLTRLQSLVQNTGHAQAAFRDQVRALPTPSIVFVRYGPSHNMHYSLITNPPDYPSAPAWIVYDRGNDNERLMAIAPERTPYLYLEEERRLVPLHPAVPEKN